MNDRSCSLFLHGLMCSAVLWLGCTADAMAAPPIPVVVDEDGTVHAPAFTLPLSSYMSEQAKRSFIENARAAPDTTSSASISIDKVRESVDTRFRRKVERLQARFPVEISEQRFAGVRTHVVTPKNGVPADHDDRVLINLHGGGFQVGAVWHGLAESIPVASVGQFKVVTIDYRMAPEHRFPAASEDVASVYGELLKDHLPENIGIFGCSAGGTLTAMAVAWLQKQKMPTPGAIGIFSAGAFGGITSAPGESGSWGGDSRLFAPLLIDGKGSAIGTIPYLSQADLRDPLVSPAVSPTVLARFPPTLLLTGTRAYDMSAAVQTQRELTKVGVDADLHLWDGMGHCFFLAEDLPESHEAYDVIARFFHRHLGNPPDRNRDTQRISSSRPDRMR